MAQQSRKHIDISPAILYWGTPVCLITTTNSDGTHNIGPMSSIFWLGHNCMLGLQTTSQTTHNILRTGHCTLNLASDDMQDAVNAIARTTGSDPMPEDKVTRGYEYVKDKFGRAGLTPMASKHIPTPGIEECPVVMEAEFISKHELFEGKEFHGAILALEMHILNVRIHPELKLEGHRNRIDSDKWRPMIMMFCELYGLKSGKLAESRLAAIDEELYRGFTGTTVEPDVLVPTEQGSQIVDSGCQ